MPVPAMILSGTRSASSLTRLRLQLAQAVDADLSGVRIVFLSELPAAALTFGDVVLVRDELLERDAGTLLGVLAHELVHVFQQRAGRVDADTHFAGLPYCRSAELEEEAEAGARAILRGEVLRLRAPQRARSRPPVLQPLISVAGDTRSKAAEFSQNFQQVLSLIPQGPDWLQWALRLNGPIYPAESEVDLIAQIQFGLHGSSVALFQSAGLRIAPSVILSLPDPDMGNLTASLQLGQLTPAAQAVLAKNNFHAEADFGQLARTLGTLGVAGQLTATTASLAEQIGLFDTFVTARDPSVSDADASAAARFAASVAQSTPEFGAAYAFYLNAIAPAPGSTAGVDPGDVPALWTAFSPLVLDYLKCPFVAPGSTDWVVLDALASFLRQSPFVGFPTIGVAIAACATNGAIPLTQPLPADAGGRMGECLLRVGGMLQPEAAARATSAENPQIQLCQDGVTRWYRFTGPDGDARLMLDAQGCLTLSQFNLTAAPVSS
jgi:hypothetical protein